LSDSRIGHSGQPDNRLIPEGDMLARYQYFKSVSGGDDSLTAQARGFLFQNLLYSLLYHENLSPRASYRPRGEQIDGSFCLDHRVFLLEAKWVKDRVSASEVYEFQGKVNGKLVGTLGVFISMSGFSDDTPETIEKGKEINTILFDGSDMDAIFENQATFTQVLDFKIRQASETGTSYVPYALTKMFAEIRDKQASRRKAGRIGEELSYLQADVGYGSPVILFFCEEAKDALILENLFTGLLEYEHLSAKVSLEIKSLGGKGRWLNRLPEIINIAEGTLRRWLSGIVLILAADITLFRANEILEQILEQISRIAMPVPANVTFPHPSIEAWLGLDKSQMNSVEQTKTIVYEAVKNIDFGVLLTRNDQIREISEFIRGVIEDKPIWEIDAEEAVERALENAEWDADDGTVWLKPLMEKERSIGCGSMEELHSELMNIAMTGGDNSMPYEGGEPVFNIDYWTLVDSILLDKYQERIQEMGWAL